MRFLIVFALFALLKQAGAAIYAGTDPPVCDACAGSCGVENGCLCAGGNKLCMPTTCLMDDNTCCSAVPGYYWDPSASKCTDEFRCNPACAGDEKCVNKSMEAVCECKNDTYISNTIADFKPTVECDGGTMTTSVSRCLLQHLGYDYNSLYLRNESTECIFHYKEIVNDQSLEMIQVKTEVGWCENNATIIGSQVYYANTLHINAIHSALITKNPIAFDFTCGFNLTMQTSLQYALNPVVSTFVLVPVTGGGSFPVTMAAYKDDAFVTLWADGEDVYVGTDIFLGIFTPDADATNFTLRVEKCTATPSNNSNDADSVVLVNEGIAVDGDVDTAVMDNLSSLEARIRISAFQFPNFPQLFIFCNVRLCSKTEACGQASSQSGRSLDENSAQLGLGFTLADNTTYSNSGSHTAFSYVMMAASLLAFLCMSFF
uniref:ZP domain-containing protein n=1 Tax=Leptobrachium leishanense TaxID=445787 RepID=A0A8C5M1W4_9ANUR